MLFGKANVPVRLSYDIPDYSTDKYVQAEFFAEGTTGGNETFITTKNLSHNSSYPGRYTVMYSPPPGYERINVRYVVYSDAGYTTRADGYWPVTEQLVLDSGVGQLGGAASVAIKPLRPDDYNQIAIQVAKILRSELESYKNEVRSIKDKFNDLAFSVKNLTTELINAIKEADYSKGEAVKSKLDSIAKQIPKIDRFLGLLESIDQNSGRLGVEQKRILTEFLQDKMIKVLLDVGANTNRELKKTLQDGIVASIGKDTAELVNIARILRTYRRELTLLRDLIRGIRK